MCRFMFACLYASFADSSQSESLSDAEDHRPSFSKPAGSQNTENNEASQGSSKFSMYNSVSQKLMVMCRHTHTDSWAELICIYFAGF